MYAVKGNGFRAIAAARDLLDGETSHETLPSAVLTAVRQDEARIRRNLALRSSDWTQAADNSLSGQERATWALYRQALRDLPQVPGFPDVAWPTPPTVRPEAGDGLPQQS